MDEMILAYMNNEKLAVQDIDTFQTVTFSEFYESRSEAYFAWLELLPKRGRGSEDPFDHPKIKEMNYIDLYALLHEFTKSLTVRNDDYTYEISPDDPAEQARYRKAFEAQSLKAMTQHMLKAQYRDGRIRLFLATPLKLYYEILGLKGAVITMDEETGEEIGLVPDWMGILEDDVCMADRYHTYDKRTDTVGEMLQKAVSLTTNAWRPYRGSVEEYGEMIEAAYRIILDILLFPFQEAYPERYGAEAVGKRHMLNDMLY